ncbi:DJ-1 family glyoxalase III [Anaerotignum sp. MB30-C6]|uniref:DJ-1 family glyoxalase III n=1 Tax=Anaerotignum sp. MB30-C6 TaxID=3070814 RepID=UPI0027DC39C9|nr:DJ-1 family glyoxalase III [Anaerotignum sp. MB30-C6]WMI81553.1 DJ-1/PfpI family protein [Anaerotignum sp. MB30-C6]
MKTIYIFLAEGFEEIEAITPLDLLRRVDIDAKFVSIGDSLQVKGAHNVVYTADIMFDDACKTMADGIILPGGLPGTSNLLAHNGLCDLIREYHKAQKPIAAICAAPMILGELGLLAEKTATIYPGMESNLIGAKPSTEAVCVDGNIITSRAPGTSTLFALKLAEIFAGKEAAENLKADIVYQI